MDKTDFYFATFIAGMIGFVLAFCSAMVYIDYKKTSKLVENGYIKTEWVKPEAFCHE